MKNHHFSLLCLCICLLFQGSISATSYTWNGGSGDWSDPTKWSPNGVPGASDDVSIAAGTANLTSNTTIHNFTVTGGGQINGSHTLTIDGTLTQNCFGCDLHVGNGDIIINGAFNWITGTIGNGTATGTVTANGLITIPDGAAGHWVRKKTLICNGGVDWQGGNIGTSNGGIWHIPFGSIITESASANYLIYDNYGGGGSFENYGTFVKTGSSTTYCGGGLGPVSFFNYGVLNHLGTGSMTFNGPMHNETGGIIQGTGSYLFNSTFTNGSTVAPGDGIGQMTMAIPSFPNSALQIEIGGAGGPGVGHDRLNINGNFSASLDTLHILLVNGYEPDPGTSFQIVSTTGTVNGEIADVFFPGDPAEWSIAYGSNSIIVTYDGIMPVSYVWNGGSGNWTDPTKWTPNGVPGAVDNATITSEVTVMLTEHEQVNHFTLGTASFHTLDGNFNLLVNDDLVLGGFLYNGGNTNIAGDFIWNAGQVGNSGTSSDVTVEGLTTIQTGVHYLLGKTLYVNGGAVQTSGMYITFGGLLVVPVGTIFEANTPDGIGIYHYAEVPGEIDNAGLFHRTGSGIYPVASPIIFNNPGTIEVDAGSSISFVAGSSLNNSGVLKGTGQLNIAGNFTNTGTIAPGASVGQLGITRTSLTNNNLEIELTSNAGPGVGHDRLNVTGSFVADGTLTVELIGGYTPEVGTTYQIVSTTGSVTGTFDVLDLPGSESEWNVTYGSSNITLEYEGIAPVNYVWNGGPGNWTDPTKWTPNGVPGAIDNVTIHSSIVQLTTDVVIAGLTFNGGQITGPYDITINGNMVFSGQLNNEGNTEVTGTMDWINGTVGNGTVNGEMTVHGLTTVASGQHYIKKKTFHANGGITHTAENIYLEYGGILHIPEGEVFYANTTSGYGMFLGGASGGTVQNDGLIIRTIPGIYYFHIDIVMNNHGTLHAQQGTIGLSGGGLHTGMFVADASATIRFYFGNHFCDGALFEGEGLIDQAGGTFTLLSDISIIDFHMSSLVVGNFNLTINGSFYFNGQMHNQGNTLVIGSMDWGNGALGNGTVTGEMTVNGLITTSAGQHYIRKKTLHANGGFHHLTDQIYFENQGVLHIPPGQEFLLNAGNGSGVFNGGLGGIIQNEGTFKRTIAGTNYITASISFNNSGTVKAETGIVYFAGGSTLTNSGTLSGTSKIFIEGTFTNTGSYAPGNGVGELQIERPSLSNNILEIEIGSNSGPGTGHDRLNVTGNFIADGTLEVLLVGGYTPEVGSSFQFVSTTGTVSGTFDVLDLPGAAEEWDVVYGSTGITLTYLGEPGCAPGGILYVDADATGDNDGSSWTNAYLTLQDALAEACTCEEPVQIWVAEGTYYPDQGAEQTNNLRTSTFALCSGVAIYGGFDGSEENLEDRDWIANPTMLHGDIDGDATLANNAYNVVTGSGTDSTALLSGFTITGGNANGGGTYPASNNNGAGMHTNAGSPSIEYCTFSGNTAGEDGGGMMSHTNSNPSISHCNFTSNTARYGGGMSNYNSCLTTVINTKFTGNTATGGADGYGGAVANYLGGSPTFINCHFSGNKANWGGALFNFTNSHSIIINTTFSGNWAANAGAGGAIRNSTTSSSTIINSIIWNNRNGTTNTNTSASILNTNGGTSAIEYSLIANSGGSGNWNAAIGTDGGNNIDANPQFTLPVDPATAPTTSGDLSLTEYSSAIGLGSNDEYDVVGDPQNDTDLANNPRVFDYSNSGIIDMGGYEFQGESACPEGSVVYVNATASGNNDGTSWANAYIKLQDALFTACSCSGITEVWVAAGTYYPDEGNGQTNNLRTSTFQLCTNKAVYGGFNGTETTLSQRNWLTNITILSGDIDQVSSTTNNAYHVVTGSGTTSTARLDGFTITLGNANDLNAPHKHGGGLYISSGSPIIANCIISNNRGRDGGGMYNLTSNTQVSGCTFTGNVGEIVIGAMLNITSTPIVTNTHFISNIGGIDGGAVGNTVSNTQFLNCKFLGNSITGGSGNGAGVHNWNSSPRFISCQFSGNKSNNRGGAIFNTTNSHSKIINCSLSGNSAGNNGGAVFNEMNSDPQITNSMIWNNRANGITTSTSASVYNLDGTCIPACNNNLIANSGGSGGGWQSAIGSDGGNNIDANPSFVLPVDPATAPTTAGNLQLTSYSPLNLGSNAAYDVFGDPQNDLDLANNPRVFEYSSSGIIDMGAYEFQGQSACPGGSIVYVNASASGANNGTSWANAFNKLQDALFIACSCSNITQVWVAAGTYYPDEGNGQTNNLRTSSFQLCNGKAVYGGFDGTETALSERDWDANETLLSGNIDNLPSTTGDAYHVVLASNTNNTALLDGFTITKGNANGAVPLNRGGGVYKENGAAKFQNMYFTLNLAGDGASYYSLFGSSTLTDCTFENNSGSVVVGGVVNQASPAVITRCHFIDNFGGIETAAIANTSATVTIVDCSFIGNEAGVGNGNAGAIHSWNSTVHIYNSLFSGNKATRHGGAIFNTFNTVANIINCTFSGNWTTQQGGAIYNEQNAIANVRNSIIWNNRAGTSTSSTSASIFNSTATTNVSYSLVANSGGSGGGWQTAIGVDQGNNIASDPLFVLNVDPATAPTFAGDLHLQTSSPAINAGNNSLNTYPFDLDGNPRISDDVIDMGAFEQYIPCTPTTWYADTDEDGLGDHTVSEEACDAPVGYVANDDDCDDTDPEIGGPTTWYIDTDDDGFGDPIDSVVVCTQPSGYVANDVDCNDTDPEIGGPTTWFADADEDGFGNPTDSIEACEAPEGYVANDDDCDDTDQEIGGPTTWYADADDDGLGNPIDSTVSCTQPSGYVANDDDCDDTNEEIGGPTTWYADADDDGFGDPSDSIVACTQPSGYAVNSTDNCPAIANPLQEDFDSDMIGDACDPDDDNDGVADIEDGCPYDPDKSEPGLCGCNVTDIDAAIAPAAPSIACQGDSEVLTASGGTSYLWSTGETTSSIEVSPAVTTSYAVTVSTSMSCSDTASVVVEVQNQAPYFEYTGNIGFEENIVYPTTGSPYTQYHFEVTYVDADGDMPISAFPKLQLDFEGNGLFTDPNDRSHLMQPADPSDLNVVDGKVYYYNAIGLEAGTNWEASFVAITEDGCDGQSLVYDVPDILVSPDVYLFANDISFSEPNPDPGEEFTVYAVIHNGSDFSAEDFTVRLLNHFTEETYTDITVSSLAPHETMTVNWVINAPAEPSWNPMRVTVDYQNTIEETNELNNTAVRPFICGDFNLPGTIVAYTAVSPDPSYEGLSIGLYGTAYYSGTAVPLQDSSCAGATVTMTIVETNQTFVMETSANGFFSTGFIAPPPGTYTIEGEVTDYTLTGYFTASFTVIEPPVIPCAIDYVCAFSGDFYIIEGESVAPQFVVSNGGCEPATVTSSASVLRQGGSPPNEEFVIPALGGGGTQVYNLSPITYTNPGTYTLYGAVDQDDDIVETIESNNVCIAHVSVVPNLPDIHADYHAPIGPLYQCWTQNITFSFHNAGVAPTGQFETRLEIFNANNELVELEVITTANLNYQESGTIGLSNYMFLASGQYTAKVTCDFPHPPGVVIESNEGNNTFEISFWVVDCGVNLVWNSICEINQGVTPVNPTNPGSITVSRRLVNAGTEDATENIPVTFEVNGNVYAEIVPALEIGESAQVSMTIPAPTHGDNEIVFTIDPEQTLTGEDPGGNVASEPLCWDFSVLYDEVCHPGSIWNYPYLVIDQPVTFDIGLVNYGLYKASPVHVSFEVSGPGISGWLDLGEVTMTGPIDKTCGCPITVSLPYTYSFDQVGLFSVRMIVDPEDVFAECSETNNEIILQIEVINVPDLKVLSQYIDPSELNPDVNEEISFNVTYQNIGMSNVQETFELLLLVDEVPIDSLQVPGLITGDFNTVSIPNTWSSLLPGLHIIRAIIDADDDVLEATNANNEATRAVIVGASTNLNFLAFTHTAPSGGSLDITGSIRNAGSLGCTADLELYYVDDFGDEHLITTIPVDIDGNSNIPFSHTWSIEDNNTTLIGRIVNVSEMEYNEDDNEATSVLQVITLDIVVTEENCIGSNDGTATVSPAGGTTPYDFQWSNGLTSPSITIGAGQYILSVTDANGNLTTAIVVIQDSGIPMQVYFLDADADGFGDLDHDTTSCGQPSGYVSNTDDCDDMNEDVNPSASETCNGIDDNCNGLIDDADPGITGQPTWYIDTDNDGYGDAAIFVIACDQPSGYVSNPDDCNDADTTIHPNATELCNETDDDCDGLIDEGTTDTDGDGICDSIDNCPSTSNPDQADNENDGIGDVCDPNDDNDPKPDNNDCAPFDPTIYPGAPEICGDLIDNDCDNKIDEALKIEVLIEQDVLCHGDATGLISVTGECGLPPYTYQWTNDSTTAMITNLIAGQYKVTVTDAQGLIKTKTINITQPSALTLTMTKTDVSCFGGSDGTTKATPNGGNAPYTYLWSNGATTKIASGLYLGTYTVTVTDENGCTITGTIGVGEPTLLEITNTVVSPDPANPGKFMITVTADGGTPYDDGYRYRRCNTAGSGCNGWQVSNELTNLNPGYYLVKVKDANGCINELIVDVEPIQSMVAAIEQIEMDVDNVRVEPIPIIEIETEPELVHFEFTSLYPNPGKEMVMIQWNGSVEEMVNIVVHDIHGRKILSRMTDGKSGRNTLEMDMSSLSEGLYIITLQRADLKYSKVWIKIE